MAAKKVVSISSARKKTKKPPSSRDAHGTHVTIDATIDDGNRGAVTLSARACLQSQSVEFVVASTPDGFRAVLPFGSLVNATSPFFRELGEKLQALQKDAPAVSFAPADLAPLESMPQDFPNTFAVRVKGELCTTHCGSTETHLTRLGARNLACWLAFHGGMSAPVVNAMIAEDARLYALHDATKRQEELDATTPDQSDAEPPH